MISPALIGIIAAAKNAVMSGAVDWWRKIVINRTPDSSASWDNYGIRYVFAKGVDAENVKITFQAAPSNDLKITKCYIGKLSGTYGFSGSPVQVKFAGSDSFTISDGAKITSDVASITLSASDRLVVSFGIDSASGSIQSMASALLPYCTVYAKEFASSEYADTSPSGYIKRTNIVNCVDCVEVGQSDPEFSYIINPVYSNVPANWKNYTVRVVIPKEKFLDSFSKVAAIFIGDADLSSSITYGPVYIGFSAGTPAYAFDDTPDQLEFGGSSTGTSSAGELITTDELSLSIDDSKDVVLSFHIPSYSGSGAPSILNSNGFSTYYKSGNDAATKAASGYNTWSSAPAFIDLQVR